MDCNLTLENAFRLMVSAHSQLCNMANMYWPEFAGENYRIFSPNRVVKKCELVNQKCIVYLSFIKHWNVSKGSI